MVIASIAACQVGLPDKIVKFESQIYNEYYFSVSVSQILYGYAYAKKLFVAYLKFKFNWTCCNFFLSLPIYTFFFIFFSIMVYPRRLDIVGPIQ